MAAKKDGIDLYNELTDKKKEYAQETTEVRKKGEQVQAEETGVGDMREIDQTETTQEEKEIGKKSKMRGFAESTTEKIKGLGKTTKDKIIKNPENYYEPQKQSELQDKLQDMTEDELIENMSEDGLNLLKDGEDNLSILAGIELINRN